MRRAAFWAASTTGAPRSWWLPAATACTRAGCATTTRATTGWIATQCLRWCACTAACGSPWQVSFGESDAAVGTQGGCWLAVVVVPCCVVLCCAALQSACHAAQHITHSAHIFHSRPASQPSGWRQRACSHARARSLVCADTPLARHPTTLRPPPFALSGSCCSCSAKLASYYCSICHLWDDEPGRAIYHCPFCNVCRRGQGLGIDFFHCMQCNACMSLSLFNTHTCR